MRTVRRLWFPALVTLFYVATARGYGVFRDELYYVACGRHLAAGYVDQPPLVALLARLVTGTLGTSLYAIRLIPALCAGVTVWLAAELARELGGGKWARGMAAVAAAAAPVYLALFTVYTMNAMDVVAWGACFLILARILASGDERGWIPLGIVAGVGLENKTSILFLACGVVAGLFFARRGRLMRGRRFWTGMAIAAALFLPYLAWEVAHGWPTLEFMRNARRLKMTAFSPGGFLTEAALEMGPAAVPLALLGLFHLFFAHGARRFRALGWAVVVVLAIVIAGGGKPYYVAPLYTLFFAAGSVALVGLLPGAVGRGLRTLYLGLILAGGALIAPLTKPLLPVETCVRYSNALGIHPSAGERMRQGRLPQLFADMQGWRELAETVERVYQSLPPEDRARAAVAAQNYGEAGAIDFFGPGLGLPHAISGHNSYFFWGPGSATGDVLIVIGDTRETLEGLFESVELATTFHNRNCMPYEDENPIWVVRRAKEPLAAIWPRVRHFI